MSVCVTSICVMSTCVMSSCVMSIGVMSSCVMSICVMPACAMSICVMSSCVPARHQRKIFVSPHGAATPKTIYTQQGAKPAWQEHIHTKFSQLLLAQLPGTQFTHSKAPNPHARKTSTQNFRSSYWHSYPEHNLHTARRQTHMAGTRQRKIFAAPIGTATRNAIYTQQGAKPAWQECGNTKFSQLLLAQQPGTQFTRSKAPNPHGRNAATQNFRSSYWHSNPERNLHAARRQTHMAGMRQHKIFAAPIGTVTRTQFTHTKAPNPHARNTSTQNFRSSYWHSYPEHNLHTARRQTRMPGRHQHKIFAAPIGTATPNTIYTQQGAKHAWQERIDTNFRSSYWHSYPEHNLHTARRQTGMAGTQQHKIFAAPIGTATRTQFDITHNKAPNLHGRTAATQHFRTSYRHSGRAEETKRRQSVHQTPCNAPRPTPATQKQRQSSADQTTPKRTSDPLQCTKPHACHAKAAAEQRRPNDAKAYIRPPAMHQAPRLPRKSSGRSSGDQTTPKRTSDPLPCAQSHACHAKAAAEQRRPNDAKAYIRPPAVHQASRLPRKSSGRAAETQRRQSVHQTPCRAPSPTPATQKQRQSSGDQTTPKCTSDPVQMQQVPRLPRKSRCQAVWCQVVCCVVLCCVLCVVLCVVCCVCLLCCVLCRVLCCVLWYILCCVLCVVPCVVCCVLCVVCVCVVCVCVLMCVCVVCVCVCLCVVRGRKRRSPEEEKKEVRRCQPKNKNPTQQCGELGPTTVGEMKENRRTLWKESAKTKSMRGGKSL